MLTFQSNPSPLAQALGPYNFCWSVESPGMQVGSRELFEIAQQFYAHTQNSHAKEDAEEFLRSDPFYAEVAESWFCNGNALAEVTMTFGGKAENTPSVTVSAHREPLSEVTMAFYDGDASRAEKMVTDTLALRLLDGKRPLRTFKGKCGSGLDNFLNEKLGGDSAILVLPTDNPLSCFEEHGMQEFIQSHSFFFHTIAKKPGELPSAQEEHVKPEQGHGTSMAM